MAGYVKSVEYVEISVTAATEGTPVNLTKGQDHAQCVPFKTWKAVDDHPVDHHERMGAAILLDNAGTAAVRIDAPERTGTHESTFGVFVVEFTTAITVQQIPVTTFNDGVASVIVTIDDAVSQDAAFFLYEFAWGATGAASNIRGKDPCVFYAWNDGVTTTEVELGRGALPEGTVNGTLYVVTAGAGEFTCQHVPEFATPATATKSEAVTIASTVMANSFVILSALSSHVGDNMRDYNWTARITGTTVATVERTGAGGTPNTSVAKLHLQIVEDQVGGFTVQRGINTLSGTSTNQDITAVNLDFSVLNHGGMHGRATSCGANPSIIGGEIDNEAVLLSFVDADTLNMSFRDNRSWDQDLPWEVIEWVEAVAAGVTASAAITLPAPTLAAAAAAERNASGAATLPALVASSGASVQRAVSAAMQLTAIQVAAMAGVQTEASAAASLPALTLTAGAAVQRSASGALGLPSLLLAATATAQRLASVAATMSGLELAANANVETAAKTASVAIAMPPAELAAFAERAIAASGDIAAPAIELAAALGVTRTASGEIVLNPVTLAAFSGNSVQASGAAIMPAPVLAALAAIERQAGVSIDAPAITLGAISLSATEASGDITMPAPLVDATASLEVRVSAAISMLMVELASAATTPTVAGEYLRALVRLVDELAGNIGTADSLSGKTDITASLRGDTDLD